MSLKQLIALVIVLAVLGVAYQFSRKGKQEQVRLEDQQKRLLTIEQKDVTRVSIVRNGERITAENTGEREWRIVEPIEAKADNMAWNSIVRNLVDARAQWKDVRDSDLAKYGLADPSLKVTFYLGNAEHTVYFGDADPVRGDYYARRSDSNEVLLIFAFNRNSVDKDLLDLRDRSILEFQPDQVRSFEVIGSDFSQALVIDTSNPKDYSLLQPITGRANNIEVDNLLRAVGTGKAVDFGPEKPSEEYLAARGLIDPATTVVITFREPEDNPKQEAILIGSVESENGVTRYWAMRESGPNAFLIEEDLVKKLSASPKSLRLERLARAQSWDVRGLLIEREGMDPIEVRRQEDDWRMIRPQEVLSSRERVTDFVTQFSGSAGYKIAEFIQDVADLSVYGLENPPYRVTIFQDGFEETFFVSDLTEVENEDVPPSVYARWEGHPTLVMRMLQGLAVLRDVRQPAWNFGHMATPTPEPPPAPMPEPEFEPIPGSEDVEYATP